MIQPPKHQLSKSTFLFGCQCPKRFWLHKYMPYEKDEEDEAQTAIFQSGTDIGLLAQGLFPNGVDASPENAFKYQESVVKTAQLIEKGCSVIYEATFQYEGILAALDILVKIKNKWYAFEVKSTVSVKDYFKQDAALQYYVITNSGLPLKDISIVYLNNKYIRNGELDLDELFKAESVMENVIELQPFIISKIDELKKVLKLKTYPEIEIGRHCTKPFQCNFSTFCNKDLEEVEEDYGERRINKVAIKEILKDVTYPVYHMDFETWCSPIPEQVGHWPYRKIPFQFSIHKQKTKKSATGHFEYLAADTSSDLKLFAKNLIEVLGTEGTIFVYNKTFENGILKELKYQFKSLAKQIEAIQERIIDLMPIFRTHYRTPEMMGSYSIKLVLPALVPELSYENLEINNGSDASNIFYNIKSEPDQLVQKRTRNNLLNYCKLDTLAMVKLFEKINEILIK